MLFRQYKHKITEKHQRNKRSKKGLDSSLHRVRINAVKKTIKGMHPNLLCWDLCQGQNTNIQNKKYNSKKKEYGQKQYKRALFEIVCIVPGSVPGPVSFRPGRQNGQGLRSRAPAGRGKYQKQTPANTHSQQKKI